MRCHKSIRFFFHKNRNERTFGCLFDETSPKEYSFLSFYQNKRFHVFIPKGSQQAPEEFSSPGKGGFGREGELYQSAVAKL